MPFQRGRRLPGEKASKVGHLDVLKNPLVNELSRTFTDAQVTSADAESLWTKIETTAEPLSIVFCADGSWQTIVGESPPLQRESVHQNRACPARPIRFGKGGQGITKPIHTARYFEGKRDASRDGLSTSPCDMRGQDAV